jgi:hypothetical protein
MTSAPGRPGAPERHVSRVGRWARRALLSLIACFVSRELSVRLASRMGSSQLPAGRGRQLELSASPTPATPTDLLWEERAEKLRFDSLADIRKSAEKWAGSIGAVTGVFGIVSLIKGRDAVTDLTRSAEISVGILVALALLFALRGILLAALAAQGTPRLIRFSGERIRTAYRAEARLAMDLLKYSRVLTVLAVLVFATAVGLTWYGPTKKAEEPGGPKILVVRRSGAVACGLLKGGTNGGFIVEIRGQRIPVSVGDVVSLTAVSSCP